MLARALIMRVKGKFHSEDPGNSPPKQQFWNSSDVQNDLVNLP